MRAFAFGNPPVDLPRAVVRTASDYVCVQARYEPIVWSTWHERAVLVLMLTSCIT